MVTFIPEYVNEERRIWADELIPLLKEASNDDEWKAISDKYKQDHGDPPPATLTDVADHIEHVAMIAGVQSVGIGGDFYGAESPEDLIVGLEDVSKYPHLIAELVRRGWTDEDLHMLTRDNILRVLSDVEVAARRIQEARPPSLAKYADAAAADES